MHAMRPWRRLVSVTTTMALIGLAGCTYVTKAQQDAKFACLDEDGDGAVKQDVCEDPPNGVLVVDCDDSNGDRFPGHEEVAYDGVDQDCDGFDLLDVDDDGFPGILEADWQSNDGAVSWPTTLDPRLDCNDADEDIYPGSAAEEAYDGVDSDCAGDDDYDFDGDGYVIRADLLPPDAPPYAGDLPGGDCDDNEPTINPGVGTLDDIAYDGIDSNCDGKNDFDRDGDTWMRDGDQLDFQVFVDRFGYSFPENFGDCNDADEFIFPGAPDAWYDGIDSDCGGEDDYDQDADGYVLREDLRPPSSPPYTGLLPSGDCDDQASDVFPGALENLGDTIDSDCDGGNDTAPFGFHDYGWRTPRPPVVGATDQHYLLTTAADAFDTGTSRNNVGVSLQFERDAGADAIPSGVIRWESVLPLPFGEQIDAVYGDDRFWIAAAHQRPIGPNIRNDLRLYRAVWNASAQQYERRVAASERGPNDDPYLGLDLERTADGALYAVACGQGTAHGARALTNASDAWVNDGEVNAEFNATNGAAPERVGFACFGDGDANTLVAFNDLEASEFSLDFVSDTITYAGADPTWSSYAVNRVVHRDNLLILSGSTPGTNPPKGVTVVGNGAVLGRYLLTDTVLHADAARLSSTLYVVAVVEDRDGDGRDDAILLYGSPNSPTEVELPFEHPDRPISATGASVFADAGRVFVAVTGVDASTVPGTNTDVVGWVFYEP